MTLLFAVALSIAGANGQEEAPWPPPASKEARERPPGLLGDVGPKGTPKTATQLLVERPGVFEDYLIDAGFAEHDAVRIRADGTVLRRCEIRNGRRDGVEVYASDVLIDSCRIHHFLAGTFREQHDAHGITGRPKRLTIRNCEIYHVSGDAAQFDPGRGPWTDVLIENCVFWTGPLPENAAGFGKGERPGENAVDTKQAASNPRSRMVIRNSVFHGWRQPGQISLMAACNLKDNVEVRVERCVFYDNEVALRLRGDTGSGRGGARVTALGCSFYSSDLAIRAENSIENLKVLDPAFGEGVREKFRAVEGKPRDLEMRGERPAPPLEQVLKSP